MDDLLSAYIYIFFIYITIYLSFVVSNLAGKKKGLFVVIWFGLEKGEKVGH